MNIKDKLRKRKIDKFIEKNRKQLEFSDQEWKVLYTINCEDLLSKIDKLSLENKQYVLQPLKYVVKEFREKYGIREIELEELYMILQDQLGVVTNNKYKYRYISDAPNLMKLFLASGYQQELYNYLRGQCMVMEDNQYVTVFTEHFKEWNEILRTSKIEESAIKIITDINLHNLEILISYRTGEDKEIDKRGLFEILLQLENQERKKLNRLGQRDFECFLSYMTKDDQKSTEDNVKVFLTTIDGYYGISPLLDCYISVNRRKFEILNKIPPYLIDYMVYNKPDDYQKILSSLYNENTEQLIDEIKKTSEIHVDSITEILASEEFMKLPTENQALIFKKLRKVGEKEETDTGRYMVKAESLIGNTWREPLLENLPNSYLEKILDFICQEEDIDVLCEKIRALRRISAECIGDEDHIKLFDKYIGFICKGLENKTAREKMQAIDIRSRHFEENHFSNMIEKLENSSQKEKIEELLYSKQTEEEMEQIYQFIAMMEEYPEETISTIINHFNNSQSIENTKRLLQYINDDKFKKSHPLIQQEYLGAYPLAKEKRIFEGKEIELDIPDFTYVNEKIHDHHGEMVFINEDTGIKVKIKTRNNVEN